MIPAARAPAPAIPVWYAPLGDWVAEATELLAPLAPEAALEAALDAREEMLEAAFPPEAEELDMAMEVEDPAAELEARLLFISAALNGRLWELGGRTRR
jgi:hypothetical protein